MKIGITEQPEISHNILKLIDFIEIKTLTLKNIAKFSKFKKPFLFHLQNILKRKWLFISDDDLIGLLNNPKVKKIINSSPFSWFSLHLGLPVKNWALDYNQDLVATSPPIAKTKFFEKVSSNLQKIKKLYPKFKILLETPPFIPHNLSKGAYYYICDPDFINQVINENNCYFLLDIGHTTVSAYNLGFKKPEDYFQKLPLKKTIEIHIHRPRKEELTSIFRDAHLPITDKEIKLLKFILKKARNVEAIILEAQGLHDKETLVRELKLLEDFKK